jgi:feruloyl esterase
MSQHFPQYFDGIVAGDPVYDLEKIGLSELYGVEAVYKSYSTYPGGTVPTNSNGQPLDYAAFPASDQALFETALMQKCDGLDGAVDGVIDNHAACDASFDPATATYTSGGKTFPLQCPGAKDATCLLPTQIQAAKKINQGPRNAFGQTVQSPAGAVAFDHVSNTAQGYVYDGGFMTPNGIPTRKIGNSPTTTPGDYSLGVGQFDFLDLSPPNPSFNAITFDFTTDVDLGHKIIWYHGHSDPGPPYQQTVVYYTQMAAQHGGVQAAQRFSRLYPIPNMGHCGGGPATDQFDLLTPIVAWAENGVAPGPVIASGSNFAPGAAGYGAVNTADVPGAGGPSSRSRPLCPYPKEARYIGPAGNSAAFAVASNYTCVGSGHSHKSDDDHSGKGESDDEHGSRD